MDEQKKSPAVSVVLPVWNGADVVERAVRSILDQTFHDFELVVLDDGSTDDTPEILRTLRKQDPRIRVLRMPHGGIVSALNRGCRAARAPVIARMDADDISLPERLERQYRFLRERPEIGVAAARVGFEGNVEQAAGLEHYIRWNNSLCSTEEIALNRFIEAPVIHPSVMFRRDLLQRFGGYREGPFPEDYDLWLRWMDAGVRFAKLPEVLLLWTDSASRLTRTDPRYSDENLFRCKAPYLARWLERNNPHHPEIVVWGAGRTTRKRVAHLAACGLRIIAWVDVDPRKIGNRIQNAPVIAPDDLPPPGACFLVSCVGVRDAREDIRRRLRRRGWIEGVHFIVAA